MDFALWDSLLDRINTLVVRDGRRPVARGGRIPDATIDEVERRLEIVFPADYREFLRTYGLIEVGFSALFGIWDFAPFGLGDGGVLGETLRLREAGLPHRFIAIQQVGYEQRLCIDTSVTDGPCLQYYTGEPERELHPCEHAETFPGYVTAFLQTILDCEEQDLPSS
jgi:hypothetical protein